MAILCGYGTVEAPNTWSTEERATRPPISRSECIVPYPAILVSILGSLLGAVLQFSLRAVTARWMGQEGYGEFTLGLAVCTVLATLCGLGMSGYLARGLAQRLAVGDRAGGKRVACLSFIVALGASVATAFTLFVFAGSLSEAFGGGGDFAVTIRVLCPLVPILVGLSLLEAFGRGLQKVWYYVGVGSILPAVLRMSSVTMAVLAGVAQVTQVATWYLIGSGAAILIGAFLMRKDVLCVFSAQGWGEHDRHVVTFASAMLGSQALGIMRARSDTLLMGLMLSMGQVGLYGAALSIAALAQIGLSAVNQVLMPWLASEYALGKPERLRETYKSASVAAFCLTLPVLLCLLMSAEDAVVLLFGKDYLPAALPLQILVVGYFVNSATGSFGVAFIAAGEPGWNMIVTTVGVISSVILLLLLVPNFGLTGAAVAMTSSLVLSALTGAFIAAMRLSLIPWSSRHLRLGLIVVASFSISCLVLWSTDPATNVALLPVRALATYACAVWLALQTNSLAPAERAAVKAFAGQAAGRMRRRGTE